MFDKKYLFKILNSVKTVSYIGLAKKMSVERKYNSEFSKFLFNLVKSGEIFTTQKREYYLPKFIGEYEGNIKISPKGFGFVDMEDDLSVFILSSNTNTAMDGDLVKVKYFKDIDKDQSYQGIVIDVLERRRLTFVGRVTKFGDSYGIIPFDKKINAKFRFENNDDLVINEEVKVEITKFDKRFNAIKIIKKLGMFDEVSMDILTAIEDANIPTEFLDETMRAAEKIPENIDGEDKNGRVDLRNKMIYTIDGDDTKDFDDAINVEKLDNGNYMLGVHIADVTHYVKEDQPIDKEAKMRGTSVYLADRVIPMLPERLSNGICSLNPNVDRFVISCEMEIDQKGNTVSQKIFPAIINSKYRLTYKEVNSYHDGKDIWNNKNLTDSLDIAFDLSKIIRKFKEDEGYIDFEIEEAKIIIDEKGNTKDIVVRERSYSEILIEDFMVRANETVAKYVSDMKLAFIYRVHDKPDFEKVSSLQNVVKALGIDVKIPMSPIPSEFAKSVKQIQESRFDDFMKIMMLRTMAKAVYSPVNIGHFGLASKNYTHFTSPIRRYPDLMVHRMLREYIFHDNKNLTSHFESIMPGIAEHSSATEQKAVELERKVADIKKAEFYEKFIGHEFEGTIVSVLNFGFFVEFPNKVGGLVHMSNLMGGKYDVTNNGFTITNGDRSFTIGDKIKVKVLGSNKAEAKIDLVVADMYDAVKEQEGKYMKNRKR